MKNKFRGWQSVFTFTFQQATKGKGFRFVTALVSFLIIGISVLISVLVAKPDKEEITEPSPITTVYVLDNSGLEETDFRAMNPEFSEEHLASINFINVKDKSEDEVVQMADKNSPTSVVIIISATNGEYQLEARIPYESEINQDDAWDLINPMISAFETNKMLQAGLSMEQLQAMLKPVNITYFDIGESSNDFAFLIKMIAPMIFSLMLYFMLLIYGQTVGKSVAEEKTTKLIETLLVSVHPYGLITGKVLATTSVALLQFVTWLLSAIVGLYGGNAVAGYFYPGYENTVITIINFIKDNIGETGMTLSAIILALIVFCIGFLFYCVLAALGGSMATKAEDIAQSQALFQLPMIFSWIISYLAPMYENQKLISTLRYIPLTAPFSVPVDLITGTIGLTEGLISLSIMLVFTSLIILLAGKIYQGLVLYSGQKVNLKTIANILRADGR